MYLYVKFFEHQNDDLHVNLISGDQISSTDTDYNMVLCMHDSHPPKHDFSSLLTRMT